LGGVDFFLDFSNHLHMRKQRLDEILIKRGVASDRTDAWLKVMEGLILVDGARAISPAQLIDPEAKIELRDKFPYVGRGALKLEAALKRFAINVQGKICADLGSATGGFTEVLLKRGARKVYAIDTARGKLVWKLRQDPRVVVMEGQDVRDLKKLPEIIDLVTIDVSLIPLQNILQATRRLLSPKGEVIALFKPQYETRDPKVLQRGIVRTKAARQKLWNDFRRWTKKKGWKILDWMESPLRGSKGNVEYLVHLKFPRRVTEQE